MGELAGDKYVKYIFSVESTQKKGSFESLVMEHLRLNEAYWGLTTLDLLGKLDAMDSNEVLSWILQCQMIWWKHWTFSASATYTSAMQVLALFEKLDVLHINKVTDLFCCVDALAITVSLHHIDKDLLGRWLCKRQFKSGGLNGLPGKFADVCYSWWVFSSLIMIDRGHWIDKEKLVKFILDCQDTENGGISDRPDDAVDIFHMHFGVAGLSLVEYPDLKP